MTKNWRRKKYSWIFFFLFFFWSKITIYLSLGLHTGRPSNRRTIQHFKRINLLTVFYFSGPFLPSWTGSGLRIRIRVRIQGPLWIRIQSGSGSGSATLLLVDRYFPTYSYQRNTITWSLPFSWLIGLRTWTAVDCCVLYKLGWPLVSFTGR